MKIIKTKKYAQINSNPLGEISQQPWEMTRKEYIAAPIDTPGSAVRWSRLPPNIQELATKFYLKETGDASAGQANVMDMWYWDKETGKVVGDDILNHKEEIQLALTKGKLVPPEVLADYPDLAKHSVAPL